ncbi:hypothetical protein, partial [Escherichia coli]|uniref:hypothetical protein n=1 Tax=Escherichia coli TaxID=562 RepID=UPI001C58ECB7
RVGSEFFPRETKTGEGRIPVEKFPLESRVLKLGLSLVHSPHHGGCPIFLKQFSTRCPWRRQSVQNNDPPRAS